VVEGPRAVRRVLVLTLCLNLSVAAAKVAWGYATDSTGMVSDGFHSMFDGASNVLGLIGIWIASRPPDRTHPYGHWKFETLFTVAISVMIFATCLQILRRVYASLTGGPETLVTPVSFAVMGATMAVNIFVVYYETRKGRQLGSQFLVADAMHTRSDLLASSAVVAGLIFTDLGYGFADPLAGLLVAGLIARIGWRIIKGASGVLVDTTLLDIDAIRHVVNAVPGVRDCHDIRNRGHERYIFLDLHVLVDPRSSIGEAHDITERVEQAIKVHFPHVKDIVVHAEPDERDARSGPGAGGASSP